MRQLLLLRGINLGPRNRIPMADLRELLTGAGYNGVRTYVQSGNVVLESDARQDDLARECQELITERFGFDVPVVVRTRDELAAVVARDPLNDVATNPKRYLVSFLAVPPDPQAVQRIAATTVGEERLVLDGRELYAWIPDGVARSKLWAGLASGKLGVAATARNWTTVTTLLKMADQ